jgi:hypothetical protein
VKSRGARQLAFKTFWFRHFWHFRAFLGILWHFWAFFGIFGHFWAFFGIFWHFNAIGIKRKLFIFLNLPILLTKILENISKIVRKHARYDSKSILTGFLYFLIVREGYFIL